MKTSIQIYEDYLKDSGAPEDILEQVMIGALDNHPISWGNVSMHYTADKVRGVRGFEGTTGQWAARRLRDGGYILFELEEEGEDPRELTMRHIVEGMTFMSVDESIDWHEWEGEDYNIILQLALFDEIKYEREDSW